MPVKGDGTKEEAVELERVEGSRHDHLGVLRGPPPLDPMVDAPAGPAGPRRADEVRELLLLVDRGLLSEEEFESQLRKRYAHPE